MSAAASIRGFGLSPIFISKATPSAAPSASAASSSAAPLFKYPAIKSSRNKSSKHQTSLPSKQHQNTRKHTHSHNSTHSSTALDPDVDTYCFPHSEVKLYAQPTDCTAQHQGKAYTAIMKQAP
jgi:hypothetical protein